MDFSGTFSEWEAASEERAHAAAVAASEDEALRRVHEKQKTKRREDEAEMQRGTLKAAQQKALEAEALVVRLEETIAELTHELADPELYTSAEGKRHAIEQGGKLDQLKRDLDKAIARWSEATEAAEAAASSRR